MASSPKDFAHALYAMRPQTPTTAAVSRKGPKLTGVKRKLPKGKPKAKPRAL